MIVFLLGFACGGGLTLLAFMFWAATSVPSSCGCVRCAQDRKRAVDPEAFSASGLAAHPRGTHGATYEGTT